MKISIFLFNNCHCKDLSEDFLVCLNLPQKFIYLTSVESYFTALNRNFNQGAVICNFGPSNI